MPSHIGRDTWHLAWDAAHPAGRWRSAPATVVTFDVLDASCGQITADVHRGRPRDARLLTRGPGRRSRRSSTAPSRATRSRSSCWTFVPGRLGLDRRHPGLWPAGRRVPGCRPAHHAPRGWRRRVPARRAHPAGAVLRRAGRGADRPAAEHDPAHRDRRQHGHPSPHRRVRACGCRSRSPGALFSLGDGHAAQGDGEVCGTAIETPVQAQRPPDRPPRRPGHGAGVRDGRAAGRIHQHRRLVRRRRRRARPVRGGPRRGRGA